MYRIDYVDYQHKPRVQFFKTRHQANERVKLLAQAGLMVIHTNWIFEEETKQLKLEDTINLDVE